MQKRTFDALQLLVSHTSKINCGLQVHTFDGPGVALAMYNTEHSIQGFARASFEYAIGKGWCAPDLHSSLHLHLQLCIPRTLFLPDPGGSTALQCIKIN